MSMKKKGFTLIELLIVIAIIGILAVAFLPSLLGAPAKGRDAQRIATIQKIQNFIVSKMLTGTALPVTDSGCIEPGSNDAIAVLISGSLPDFGGVFPKDPSVGTCDDADADVVKSGYGYIKYTVDANHKYSAGVYAKVENTDNGNITCVLAATDSNEPALGETGECYLSLIQ